MRNVFFNTNWKLKMVLTTALAVIGMTPSLVFAQPTQVQCEVDEFQAGNGTPSSPLMGYKKVLDFRAPLTATNLPAGYPDFMATGGKGFSVEDGTSYELFISASLKASSATDPGSANLYVSVGYTSNQVSPITSSTNMILAGSASAEGSPSSLTAIAGNEGTPTVVWNHGLKAICTMK